jgi:diguanylate cyclase (GGDEF)-like protein
MPRSKAIAGQRTIRLVGLLIGLYLTILIAFGYSGQLHLTEALVEQERLSIEKQATAIGYFLSAQQALVNDVAASRPMQTFLANRDLGMSMEYGLRASLMAVKRDFEHLLKSKRVSERAVFNRAVLIEPDGQVLLDVTAGGGTLAARGPTGQPARQATGDRPATPQGARSPYIERAPDGVQLTFTASIPYKEHSAGQVAASTDAASVLRPLLADAGDPAHHRRTALVDRDDRVIVANNGHDWTNWRGRANVQGEQLIIAPVPGGRFTIVSFADVSPLQGVLISPLFLAALAFMSVPLLLGVLYVLRLSNHNLVLTTRFQATRNQRALLRQQNERLKREIDKRLESEQKLAHQANYDQLTGLPNRSLALDRLAQAVKWARREEGKVLVLFLDLDRFKQVNDSLGHAAGDDLLREASARLQAQVRESDTVSRLGGDEFLVICPQTPEGGDWEYYARRLLGCLSQPFYLGDHEFFVGASIGIAAFPEGGNEPQRLLKNADIAMYAAKERGRNRYCYYDPSMDAEAMHTLKLEHNLRHALERNEFHLNYQPIVELSSGRTVAVEALLRWTSAELGNVSPDTFIPVAEETGVIHEIGEWVLREACNQIASLELPFDLRVAVNLSSKQFSRPGRLLDCVLLALRESGLMPDQLELEITESVLIDDRPETNEVIEQLDRIGVRLSIDDFGTGYSALNYLQRFPFDVLKIDRSFTNQVPDNEASASLIRAIVAMAHALGLEVIAEGIEERKQVGFLLVQHCELGQGYLYSKPVGFGGLRDHLQEQRALSA